ncbi:uncharacterized protein [Argopecten irradians]|uniref:uncharacterized protein n=1 Tax=Argopecten irradians TaxID=31199 RepID=UPI003714EA05
MDFAENFTCFSQNEVQAAHWAQNSVTLHPVIARYKCPECNDDIIEESIDVVSDDLTHDCHAVHVFTDKVFSYIKNTRQIDIERAIIISDGCAAKYKSKIPFMDVSCSMNDYDVSVERCYYGSRHGKNRCDGEAGVIKSNARRAVKSGAIIKDALTFFEVVKSLEKTPTGTQCKHSLRKIIFVHSHEIQRERPDRNAKTLAGTRKIHSLRGLSRGELATRRLSCFSEECVGLKYEKCLNTQHVDKWKTTKMKHILLKS